MVGKGRSRVVVYKGRSRVVVGIGGRHSFIYNVAWCVCVCACCSKPLNKYD